MMQAAEPWHRNNLATRIGSAHCFTRIGCSLRQREVRPIVVVIADILFHQTSHMPFVENDHMVVQIPTTVPDPALCDAILPRAPETGPLRLDAEAFHGVDHFLIEVGAAIKD